MTRWTPPGQMRKRLLLERPDPMPTAEGETTGRWLPFCWTWAKIEPLSGRELWIARQQQDLSTHRIRLRYRGGVEPRMRALYNGRRFNFTAVLDLEELHRELEITATEVQEPGPQL